MKAAGLSKMPTMKATPFVRESLSSPPMALESWLVALVLISSSDNVFSETKVLSRDRPVKASSQFLTEQHSPSGLERYTCRVLIEHGYKPFGDSFREVSKEHDLCFNYQEKTEVRAAPPSLPPLF